MAELIELVIPKAPSTEQRINLNFKETYFNTIESDSDFRPFNRYMKDKGGKRHEIGKKRKIEPVL